MLNPARLTSHDASGPGKFLVYDGFVSIEDCQGTFAINNDPAENMHVDKLKAYSCKTVCQVTLILFNALLALTSIN